MIGYRARDRAKADANCRPFGSDDVEKAEGKLATKNTKITKRI
jgi:hypothetical protein